ncbi:glutathione S-transferase family protein [soil metagenome]
MSVTDQFGKITLYGAPYSVYVRAVRMALAAKRYPYRLVPVDVFAPGENTEAYRKLHPFGRIPVLQHGRFTLYETAAINRYIDEAFPGPNLQPPTPRSRARMVQIMSMADSYGYRPLVWDVYVERVSNPREGKPTDEARIAAALPKARIYLAALSDLMESRKFLAAGALTLAECHTAPVIGYFAEAPEGSAMLAEFPRLDVWWARIAGTVAWQHAISDRHNNP